ncbi:MAG: hypothetical protein JSW52_08530 [Candidatus Coatesbacteria bacterium]|nr:MAG: hypothetical protein JSW52_08530 [Candidatus Coatesbacteria bacterium]
MRKVITLAVLFVIATSVAFAQTRSEFTVGGDKPEYSGRVVTEIQRWDYLVSDYGFGVAIAYEGIGAGNLWISDWGASYGFYEHDRDGTVLSGFIPAIDDGSTQDCAYMIDDELWVVGYYYDNRIDFYDDAGIVGSSVGPPGWGEPWGVAYSNEDNNLIYVGQSDYIAYGAYVDYGTDVTWTELHVGDGVGNFTGLGYYAPSRTAEGRYLFGVARLSDPWTNTLYVFNVNDVGVPDVVNPAYTFDLNSFLDPDGSIAGCEWDGEHLWLLDQSEPDYVIEFDLGLDDTNITPASLGNIKASFK